MKTKTWKNEEDWNEALLVAHLLGGRYGFEDEMPIPDDAPEEKKDEVIKNRVSQAIKVAKEIQRQLGRKM